MSAWNSAGTDPNLEQNKNLSKEMNHWLELFDEDFVETEVLLSRRPLEAVMLLLSSGAIELKFGEDSVDVSKPYEHLDQIWFQVLYAAVEYWYIERFGFAAVSGQGTAPLEGVVIISGVSFSLVLPANRSKVEIEGEQAWMYFEESMGEGEQVEDWIIDGPNLSKFDATDTDLILSTAIMIANTLRYVEFRRIFTKLDDPEIRTLVATVLTYLTQAAKRISSNRTDERGPCWFDLQMANESALKAVLRLKTGRQPNIHDLSELLKRAVEYKIDFDGSHLDSWPSFSDISDWRYGQGTPLGLEKQYQAYLMTLHLVRAAMQQIPTNMNSGFGLLLRYAPWKFRKPNTKNI